MAMQSGKTDAVSASGSIGQRYVRCTSIHGLIALSGDLLCRLAGLICLCPLGSSFGRLALLAQRFSQP